MKKFGTFKGVYLPSLLTILGVIMYLRLGWVIGNVGLFDTIIIVTISSAITFITGLSISSIATNMRVGGGGAYYMISRSLGIEAGSAVGISLFLAQAVGISFYISGFAESMHDLLPQYSYIQISLVSLFVLTFIAYISADIALKVQLLILFMVLASLFSLFAGHVPVGGFTSSVASPSDINENVSFWIAFAIFFPAVTGIEAGVSMSGEIKDPARSLPKGTLAAVITGYVIYIGISIFLNFMVPKNILISNPMVMQDLALFKELILVGIWGATLSSALGAILGAPRTLQAMARDNVLPGFLGKGSGKSQSPRFATAFVFLIALISILLGDINSIAPVLSMFFLTSYGTLNLIAGIEQRMSNPSWRPKFRTNYIVSFIGAFLCIAAMLMIHRGATFVALLVVVLIYFLTSKRTINTRWSDIRRSMFLSLARFSIYKLHDYEKTARTWKPNIMLLSGSPASRWNLIQLADAITHGKGFLTVASILYSKEHNQEKKDQLEKTIRNFLKERKIPALVEVNFSESYLVGAKDLVSSYGLGSISPNIFMFGVTEKKENYEKFAELIRSVYNTDRNIIIYRGNESGSDKVSDINYTNKKIHCWWGGQRNNAGFMLAMAFMLQTSQEWKGSELTINTIVRDENDKESYLQNLEKFLSESRINADPNIVVDEKNKNVIETTIKNNSKDADIVFLGLRPPLPDETNIEYAAYYSHLLDCTNDFPNLVFVLATDTIKFRDIFE